MNKIWRQLSNVIKVTIIITALRYPIKLSTTAIPIKQKGTTGFLTLWICIPEQLYIHSPKSCYQFLQTTGLQPFSKTFLGTYHPHRICKWADTFSVMMSSFLNQTLNSSFGQNSINEAAQLQQHQSNKVWTLAIFPPENILKRIHL